MSAFSNNSFRSLWATFLLSIFCSGAYGNALKLNMEGAEQLSALLPGKGYVLFYVNATDTAPSVFFQAINPNSAKDEPVLWGDSGFQLDLSNREKQFYAIQLTPGSYQITRIETPLYDFSYKMTTEMDPLWRFKVEPGKLNFAGELLIATQRSQKEVEVELINRFALHQEAINQQFAEPIKQYPLVSAFIYRDDFLPPVSEVKQDANQ